MKLLAVLGLLISMTVQADLGRTFTTEENFKLQSYASRNMDYEVDSKISILVERMLGDEAEIYLNNKLVRIPVRSLSTSRELDVYEGTIREDIIYSGSICDEAESVKYLVTIEVDKEEYGHRPDILKAVKVIAEHHYSWEVCHDTSWGPESTIIYNLAF